MKFILTSLACICGYLTFAQCSVNSTTNSTISSCGVATGSATVTPTDGTAPYTYSWSNGASTSTIVNVAAGTYTVTITDVNGCTGNNSVVVTNPGAPTTSITSLTNVDCFGSATGNATTSASGGTAPYVYSWNNGANTSNISNVVAGIYTLTVTDAAACISQVTATITQPSQLSTTCTATAASCSGMNDGVITSQTSGGSAPYFYMWSTGANTANVTGLAAGNYTLDVTDVNGCNVQITANVTEPDPIRDTISASACESYFWEGQNYTTSDYYEHTYTTTGGCDSIVTLNLTINPLPNNAVTGSGATFTATASGATYQWINCSDNSEIQGAQNQSFTATQNGSYAVIVSNGTCADTSSCVTLSDLGLENNDPALVSIVPNPTKGLLSVSAMENTRVRLTNLVGESIHTYYLETGANSIDISELPAGTYLLVGSRSSYRIVKQ